MHRTLSSPPSGYQTIPVSTLQNVSLRLFVAVHMVFSLFQVGDATGPEGRMHGRSGPVGDGPVGGGPVNIAEPGPDSSAPLDIEEPELSSSYRTTLMCLGILLLNEQSVGLQAARP